MSGSEIARAVGGHFVKGVSANPGGRSGSLQHVRSLMQPHAERYVAELVRLFGDPDPQIRLAALREFGDRLLGKPVQTVESDARVQTLDIGSLYLQAVRQVNEREATKADTAKDVTPANNAKPVSPYDDAGDGQW
jgi:hypothetical protein